VLASASLFGIYLVLKYFPDLSLQTLLDAYFFLLGTAAITGWVLLCYILSSVLWVSLSPCF
jgi:hypothetical protein